MRYLSTRFAVCGLLAVLLGVPAPLAAGAAPVRGGVSAPSGAATGAATGAASGSAATVHEIRIYGRSVKGRSLRAFRIGDPAAPVKVVLMAAMHGNETGPSRILLDLLHGAPVTGADVWVIPYVNPDGVARRTRANARGVDLNRNFPVDWKRRTGHYDSGTRPASEPETRALLGFLRQVRPRFVVSMHQPLYGVDTSYGKARKLALRLAAGLHLPRTVFNCTSGCHGTMTQWYNRTFPGAALTVEYGAKLSTRQVRTTGPTGLLSAVWARR